MNRAQARRRSVSSRAEVAAEKDGKNFGKFAVCHENCDIVRIGRMENLEKYLYSDLLPTEHLVY